MKKPIALLALLSTVFVITGCNNAGPSGNGGGDGTSNTAQAGDKTVTSLAVKTNPTKTEYFIGEEFDPAGCVITVTYDDKTTEDIPLTDERLTYSAPNTDTEGTKTVRVRMGSSQVTFQITVVA